MSFAAADTDLEGDFPVLVVAVELEAQTHDGSCNAGATQGVEC